MVRKKQNNFHSIHEAITVGDMERSIPRICVALENQQVDHQTSIIDIEGMINNQPISILIDPSESMSYISPRIVELCKFVPKMFDKLWMVQSAIGTKHKVTSLVRNCKLMMNNFITHADLNILPLGS